MKLILTFLLLCATALAQGGMQPGPGMPAAVGGGGGGNTITFVTGSGVNTGNDGQTAMTTGSITTQNGDGILFAGSVRNNAGSGGAAGDCTSITLTGSTTPSVSVTQIGAQYTNSVLGCMALFYAPVTSTSYTVTVTQTGTPVAARMAVVAIDTRGSSGSTANDATCRGQNNIAGSPACGDGSGSPASITPANGSGIIVCAGWGYTGGANAAGTGFTIPTNGTDGYGANLSLQYKQAPGAGSITPAITTGGTVSNIICGSLQ